MPRFGEITVLAAVVLSFFLRQFLPAYPLALVPPSVVLLALALIAPKLASARWPLLIISLIAIVTSLLRVNRVLPCLNEWPLDLYLTSAACLLLLRWNHRVDLRLKWNFRFTRLELLSALVITLGSVAALTVYFLNYREVAKLFPFPPIPTWSLPLFIIVAAVINGLREELLYRVILQRTFQASLTDFWSVIIQAFSFGFLHFTHGFPQGWIGVGLTFLFGIFTGLQFLWSRSIALIWLTHAATDAAMFTIILACR